MGTTEPEARTFADSVHVAAAPQQVYDVVSDVTRTGQWSVFTRSCEWEDADGPRVGAHFVGHNSRPGRDWDTRSEVVAADPGREFAWAVNGLVRWGFEIEAEGGGTRLTHRWVLPPDAQEALRERFGDEGLELRTADAHESIPTTLAAIARVIGAEHGRRPRIRMPADDRIPPEQWVVEEPHGPSPTQHAAAAAEEARRRKEIEYGAGGFG